MERNVVSLASEAIRVAYRRSESEPIFVHIIIVFSLTEFQHLQPRPITNPTSISRRSCGSSSRTKRAATSAFAQNGSCVRWVKRHSTVAIKPRYARWRHSSKATMLTTGATSCGSSWCGARAASSRTTMPRPTRPPGAHTWSSAMGDVPISLRVSRAPSNSW